MQKSYQRKGRIKRYRAKRYGYESGKNKGRQPRKLIGGKSKRLIFFSKREEEREEIRKND